MDENCYPAVIPELNDFNVGILERLKYVSLSTT